MYELTPEAESLFPKAYAATLGTLLEVLADADSVEGVRRVLRDSGRRLAVGRPPAAGGSRERLQAAADVVSALGGLAEVEERPDGRLLLRGFSCPLAELVPGHPELCLMTEALVSEISGLAVHECCDRTAGNPPRCQFEVDSSG